MKKILLLICAMVTSLVVATAPVGGAWAETSAQKEKRCADRGVDWRTDPECQSKCVETSQWGTVGQDGKTRLRCDDGNGDAMKRTLLKIIDIFSGVVGVLCVLGIGYVGFKYLTAGGDMAKVTKAKRRIVEIIVGLIVYALLYVILRFLIPGFESATTVPGTSQIQKTNETSIVAKL